MSDVPLVSVVMPAYNASSTIEESCFSVLSQTYQNLELLIIDDGSTDDTLEKIRRLQDSDKRIRHYSVENKGVSSARNTGIAKASGSYLAFIDADDLYHPDKIQSQVDYLESAQFDAVVSGVQRFIDKKSGRAWLSTSFPPFLAEDARSKLVFELPTEKYCLFITILAKKKVFESGHVYDSSIKTAEDWDLWIRLSSNFTFGRIEKALYFYRKHESSATAAYRDIMTLNAHLDILRRAVNFNDEKSKVKKRVRAKYLEFFNHALFKGAYFEAAAIAFKGSLSASIFFDRRFYEILKDRISEKLSGLN